MNRSSRKFEPVRVEREHGQLKLAGQKLPRDRTNLKTQWTEQSCARCEGRSQGRESTIPLTVTHPIDSQNTSPG